MKINNRRNSISDLAGATDAKHRWHQFLNSHFKFSNKTTSNKNLKKTSLLTIHLVALTVSVFLVPLVKAAIVGVDSGVPHDMDAGGTFVNPAEYIVGGTGAFNRSFSSEVGVGIFEDVNYLTVRFGSQLSNINGFVGGQSSSSNNIATVTGSGSKWINSTTLDIGVRGSSNSLMIKVAGVVSNTDGTIGVGDFSNVSLGNNNIATVTDAGSTWTNSGSLIIGNNGSGNTLTVKDGGAVSNTSAFIGRGSGADPALGSSNAVSVSGSTSTWTNSGSLVIGRYGSGNTLTIENSALVKVGDAIGESISFSTLGGSNNFLRLDGGYIALFGNQTTDIGTLITAGRIQLWNGSAWVTAIAANVGITYYANNGAGEAAALANTGHSGLKDYTVATIQTVPEPGTCALVGLGLTALLFRRKRNTNI